MKFKIVEKNLIEILNDLKNKKTTKNIDKLTINNADKFRDTIKSISIFEEICVIGDYDVDGVMATAITLKSLRYLGFKRLSAIIPNRFTDGYGLSKNLIDRAYENNIKTIITVDNGIREYNSIEYAKSFGIRVIVTDHHTPPAKIPNADLVICSHFGSGVEICGAMLVYQLFKPLLEKKLDVLKMNELLVFASFATIADCMPLVSENYEAVKETIRIIRDNQLTNDLILSIMNSNNIKSKYFDAESISFSLVPILNSSGRLDTAFWALEALMNPSELLNNKLAEFNSKRKELTNKNTLLAKEKLCDADLVNVIYLEDIEEGIVGIVAGKICEATDKPTFIFSKSKDGHIKGSGRSPIWFNLIENVKFLDNKDYNIKYGGHSGAMGLSLKSEEALIDFKNELEKRIRNVSVKDTIINVYEWKKDFDLFGVRTKFDEFEPFGFMNEEPLFHKKLFLTKVKPIGEFKNHYSFVTKINGEEVRGCYFFADKNLVDNEIYDVVFAIKREENFKGEEIISVKVKYVY